MLIFHSPSPPDFSREVFESLNALKPKGTELGIWSGILFQGLFMIYGADMTALTHYILQ